MEWLTKRPHWAPNEGWWRIIQVLRVVSVLPWLGIMIVQIDRFRPNDWILLLAFIASTFFATHLVAWTVCWIVAGFRGERQPD